MDEPVAATPSRWGAVPRWTGVAVVAALVGLLGWATLAPGGGRSLVSRIAAGERPQAPGFDLEVVWPRTDTWPTGWAGRLADGRLELDELDGRPRVLNFWASWCGPCRAEAPLLDAAARAHRGEVVFVGIDVQDLRDDADAFLREFRVPYAAVRDRANRTYESYGLTGVPETYYLDAAGRIVAHTPGAVSRGTLALGIAEALGSPAP